MIYVNICKIILINNNFKYYINVYISNVNIKLNDNFKYYINIYISKKFINNKK